MTESDNSTNIESKIETEEDCDRSIYGIVNAIKDIKGVKCVIVNESSDGMGGFDM